jgi:DNA repair protein RadA/Sms
MSSTLVFGEVGLAGEVRPAISPEMRLKEASALGFLRGVIPSQPLNEASSIQPIHVRNLQDAQQAFFA